MPRAALLPYTAPAWLTPRRVAIVAVAVAGLVLAVPSVAWMSVVWTFAGERSGAGMIAASTAFLSAIHARVVIGTSVNDRAAWTRSIGFGAVFGILNCSWSLALCTLAREGLSGFWVALLAGCVAGVFVGAPIGLLYGILYAPMLASGTLAVRCPSHDALDRALTNAGVLFELAAAAALGLSVSLPSARNEGVGQLAFAVGLMGVMVHGVGAARLRARRRFVRRVARGRCPGWSIEPRDVTDPDALLPLERDASCDAVLVHAVENPTYRSPAERTPVALVPTP
jgi:hypothetical protein